MKSILLNLFLLLIFIGAASAQSKLIATSTYHHDSTGFFINDSSSNFYKAANTTSAEQFYNDAVVSSTTDSTYAYGNNAGTMYLSSKAVNTYNANYSQRTKYLGYIYNNLGVNTYTYQTDYYYNGLQLDSSIGIYTNVLTNNTYKYYNTFYHYNGLNQMDTTWIIYFTNLGVYSSSVKQANIYTGNNLVEVLEYHSTDSINYTPANRYNYYYNANNTTDSIVSFQMVAPVWQRTGKNEFNYNANNMKISKEYFGFNNVTQSYSKTARDQYLRSNNTQVDTLYSQLWNQGTASYDTTIKNGYIYQSGLLLQAFGFKKDVGSVWEPNPYDGIRNYYYDVVPSHLSETKIIRNQIAFYPNPVEHQLTIMKDCAGAKYAILTLEGRYVQSGFVDAKNQVTVQNLSEGTYHILVEQGKLISNATFIKF